VKGFVALHARRLFEHRLRAMAGLAGIAVATALLVAVLSLSTSVTGSVARAGALAGRADVEISAVTDNGFGQQLLSSVQRTPGVAAAVPYLRTIVTLGGQRTVLLGFDERARALGIAGQDDLSRRLHTPDGNLNGVFLGPDLAQRIRATRSTRVVVQAAGGPADTQVLDVLGPSALTNSNGGLIALAPLPVARQLTGRSSQLDGVYVIANRGVPADQLERRLTTIVAGRAIVGSPRLLADQAAAAAAALQTGLLSVSTLALLVAMFVVFNTVSMSALERHRELATLRALGARRRPLLAGFVAEAGVLGLIGAIIGSVGGVLGARQLVARIPTHIGAAFDRRIGFILPPAAIPVALAVGTLLAVIAATLAGLAVVRVAPVEAMRPDGVLESHEATGRIRWSIALGGLAATATALALGFTVGASAVLPTITLFWGGGMAAAFGFATALAAAAGGLARRLGIGGQLAAAGMGRAPRRTFVTAAAVAVAVALVVAQTGTERNVHASLRDAYQPLAATDLVITTHQPENLAADQLLPDRVATQLTQLPGIGHITAGQDAYATVGAHRVLLHGVQPDTTLPAWRLAPSVARQAVLDSDAVIVTQQLARYQNLNAGDHLALPAPTGAKLVRVAAVVNTFGSERGDIVLALEHLHSWYARPGLTRIELTLTPGAERALTRTAVAARVAASGANARLLTGAQAAAETEGAGEQIGAVFNAIELVIILGAALAILNTLTMAVAQRRRELGVLRAIGTRRRQLRRSVFAEATAIGALGATIGLALGLGGHYFAVLGTQQVGGVPVTYRFDPIPLALAALGAVALTIAGASLPAWRTSRLNVIEAIGYE